MLILLPPSADRRHLSYTFLAGDPHPSLSPAQCLPLFPLLRPAKTSSSVVDIVEVFFGGATSHPHGQEAAGEPHQRP